MSPKQLDEIRKALAERWDFGQVGERSLASYDEDTLTRLVGLSLGLGDLFGDDIEAERDWIGQHRFALGDESGQMPTVRFIIIHQPHRLPEAEALLDQARNLR